MYFSWSNMCKTYQIRSATKVEAFVSRTIFGFSASMTCPGKTKQSENVLNNGTRCPTRCSVYSITTNQHVRSRLMRLSPFPSDTKFELIEACRRYSDKMRRMKGITFAFKQQHVIQESILSVSLSMPTSDAKCGSSQYSN